MCGVCRVCGVYVACVVCVRYVLCVVCMCGVRCVCEGCVCCVYVVYV